MPNESNDAYRAGRLVQWSLRARERPAQAPEYQELVDRYLSRSDFRALVKELAQGLGLSILDISEYGMVLVPDVDSVFAFRPADFRATASTDDRLLDGLVQLAIATTIFSPCP